MAGLACAVLALSTVFPGTAMATATVAESAGRPKIADVQKALETVARTPGVVGVIGEVYYEGKRIGKGSAGSRLLDGKGGKIPSDARYRIGSQTKQMTATIVMQLVREGKLSLDDKLSEVLPQGRGSPSTRRRGPPPSGIRQIHGETVALEPHRSTSTAALFFSRATTRRSGRHG
jgi:D-alanyl-D-alanine carboxypeptidase